MTWHFKVKDANPLFAVAVADVPPNTEHVFENDMRWEHVEPGIAKSDHVSALISGESTTTYAGHEPYTSTDFSHECPICFRGKQTGPNSDFATAVSGPSGCVYVCFTAPEGTKLDYECFTGPHQFRTTEASPSYMVTVKGAAVASGIGECEEWKITEMAPKSLSLVEGDEDCIVFYIWKRA